MNIINGFDHKNMKNGDLFVFNDGRLVEKNPSKWDREYEFAHDMMQCSMIFGLGGYSFNDKIWFTGIYDGKNTNPTGCIVRFIHMGGNPGAYIAHIELIRLKNTDGTVSYIWWMQCTKKYNNSTFLYRNDRLTGIILKAFDKKYNKNEVNEKDFNQDISNRKNAKDNFENFLDETEYNTEYDILSDMNEASTNEYVMYAVFVDDGKWDFIEYTDDSFEDYGYHKEINGVDIYYKSGSHLCVKGSSYDYSIRAAVHDAIMKV